MNQKQKEVLAQFYSNIALVILSFGLLAPIFTGSGNPAIFIVKLILSVTFTAVILDFALKFVR